MRSQVDKLSHRVLIYFSSLVAGVKVSHFRPSQLSPCCASRPFSARVLMHLHQNRVRKSCILYVMICGFWDWTKGIKELSNNIIFRPIKILVTKNEQIIIIFFYSYDYNNVSGKMKATDNKTRWGSFSKYFPKQKWFFIFINFSFSFWFFLMCVNAYMGKFMRKGFCKMEGEVRRQRSSNTAV